MTAAEVEQVVLQIAPREQALPGDPTGLIYGSPQTEVTGVAVTWTPNRRVLRQAAAENLNFILTHEVPFIPEADTEWFVTYGNEAEAPANAARQALLDRHRMVVCRCHSNWDAAPGEGVADSLAKVLGFPAPVHTSRFVRVYEIPQVTLAELATRVKSRLGLPQVRVGGDLARLVSRVGLGYGGLAQSFNFVDEFAMHGADVVIAGEAVDYAIRGALDAGIAFIETSHIGSENPGMRNFARLLRERLPTELPVEFIDAGHEWTFL